MSLRGAPVALPIPREESRAELRGPGPKRRSPTSAAGRRRTRLGVALALAAAFVGALAYSRRLFAPCDDTYIYLVYVKNLLAGRGLTFNGLRVEGFTSPLWVGLVALAGCLPLELPTAAELLSAASGLAALVATYVLGRQSGLPAPRALIAPALLAVAGDFAFYMGVGLETVLFTALAALVAACTVAGGQHGHRSAAALGALVALTILARPEGVLFGGALLAGRRLAGESWRRIAGIAGTAAAILVPV